MEIVLGWPVLSMSGSVGDTTYITRNGKTTARPKTRPANPQTAEQRTIRDYFSVAVRGWHCLSPSQCLDWSEYAEVYGRCAGSLRTAKLRGPGSGMTLYTQCNVIRQVLGLPLITNAPTVAPPAPLVSITQAPAGADEVGVIAWHGHEDPSDLALLVRSTPATVSLRRKPELKDCRYVRGISPLSSLPLLSSGRDYVFGPTKHVINAGERFGVEARIVRISDGMASAPLFEAFIKKLPKREPQVKQLMLSI